MKKLLLILALLFAITMQVFAVSGTYTDNGYFYLPDYGAYGATEWEEYNTYMQVADTQIEANKDAFGNYYLKTAIDTQGEMETIWGVSLANDGDSYLKTEMDSFSELQAIISDKTLVNTTDKLSVFAATTSAELAGVISDETGTGKAVFNTAPTIKQRVTTKTTTATLTVDEAGTILVSASSAYTITLPTAVGNTGLTYKFKKTDANYNLITLDGDGTETLNYENADGVAKETYARLNTYCAEVTLVSDGANWQVYDEALGQVPMCLVSPSIHQTDIPDTFNVVLNLDTKSDDIGSNFDTSTWVSGTADGTVVDHLQDDGESPFVAGMVGYRVKNITDTTYAWITAVNDAGDVTLSADIFVNGEGYEIKNSKFVCPIAGTYMVKASLRYYSGVVADKSYYCSPRVSTIPYAIPVHSASTAAVGLMNMINHKASKDDEIILKTMHTAGVDTPDIQGDIAYTHLLIRLISKD